MLCESCKKLIATVHLTEIHSGEREERHLCDDCARTMNLPLKQPLSINDLIGVLMEKGQNKNPSKLGKTACPECGITFQEFKNKGRMGCAHDYECFRDNLMPLLEKMHGSSQYVGKVPPGHGKTLVFHNELSQLKERLQKAVQIEDYEEAATLRDRILELETMITTGEGANGEVPD